MQDGITLTERSTQRTLSARIVAATVDHLLVHERTWRPALRAAKALDSEWDWHGDFVREELPSERYETYAVVLDGASAPEALMTILVSATGLYVERLASSPENRSGGRLKSTATALLLHAVRRSAALGFGGALSLHSLEDEKTIGYYRDAIGMVEVGSELVDGVQMRRFELSRDAATRFLGETS
ncbi:MAG: hypothetical protein MUC96_08735 [Myxococcaceae bacterium]|nr:hypothetical protein [Myxococcaceae bacterium]